MHREILHLDVDAFFASVEQRDDPRLRGRPVAVGAGVVASCSYEARRFGVRTAMGLAQARQLCPPLIVVPGSYPRYEQVARQLLAVCQERTPVVEVAALDDIYLDLTQTQRSERVARELREQVGDEIHVSVAVGLGSNKLVAKVATKQAKPGRQVQVPHGGEKAFLAPWPVETLPGAGRQVRHTLERVNVHQVGEVAAMPVGLMERLFKKNRGRQLHEFAHGLDWRPVQTERRPAAVSRCTSFDPPVADRAFLDAMLIYLLERAASWMRYQDLAARGLTLSLCYGDYQNDERRELWPTPTQRDDELRDMALDSLGRLYARRLPLRRLGVELTPLVPKQDAVMLYADPRAERFERLTACKDAIRRRFGFLSLLSAQQLCLTQALPHDRERVHLRTACLTR